MGHLTLPHLEIVDCESFYEVTFSHSAANLSQWTFSTVSEVTWNKSGIVLQSKITQCGLLRKKPNHLYMWRSGLLDASVLVLIFLHGRNCFKHTPGKYPRRRSAQQAVERLLPVKKLQHALLPVRHAVPLQ